ncbi:MAG: mechanosensitive ion channel [Clostridia bacterium]|nr:mechanosensitive ion channel [Clostridia bacterium]
MINLEEIRLFLATQGINLLRGIMVLVIGFVIVHWVFKLLDRSQKYTRIDPTIRGFLDNLIRIGLYIIVILTAVSIMGIPMTSVITLVASAGVAVSLAVQGALTNLVGGVMLLLLKPIKVGEFIKAGDIEGIVKRIGAFYTELSTPDNRFITVPNSMLTNTAIYNNSRLGTRRVDITFSVSYQADIEQVKAVLTEVVNRCETVMPEPAPAVLLNECGDSSLKFVIRVWTQGMNFRSTNLFLLEEGKKALDSAGISIPYPQLDVHLKQD